MNLIACKIRNIKLKTKLIFAQNQVVIRNIDSITFKDKLKSIIS